MEPKFLSHKQILKLYANMIQLYGGSAGVRDPGLLDSAIAMPRASFGGEFLHEDLYMMAAAYLYHLVQNHAFIDGNKRIGAAAALAFLDLNGVNIDVEVDQDAYADLVLAVAQGQADKAAIAAFLREQFARG